MTAAHKPMNQITTLGGGKTRVAGLRRFWAAPAEGAFGDGRRRFLGWRLHSQSGVALSLPAALQHHGNTFGGAKWRQITWAPGKTTTFHYNALGERTKMVHTDGSTTRTEYYLYDGPRPIQRRSEGTATSNIDREYLSGGERRWNTGTGAWATHHYCRDHLGSVREVLDSSGTLLARYDYAPYGERQTRYEAAGYSSDVGFTGHFLLPSPVSGQSEILLAHYRAYDPVLGRWLSQDPIREGGGINLYGYVENSPVDFTDLLGLVNEGTGAGGPPRGGWGAGGSGLGGGGGGGGFRFGGGGGPAPRPVPNTSQPSTVPPQPAVRANPPTQSGLYCPPPVNRGSSSCYRDVTVPGSRYMNRSTNVSKADFEKSLIDSGYTRSVSKDGKTVILQKGGAKYVLRDGARSTGGPTADYYSPGSQGIDVKIRLEATD